MPCEHCKGWGVDFTKMSTDKPNLLKKLHKKNTQTTPVQCKVCRGEEHKKK